MATTNSFQTVICPSCAQPAHWSSTNPFRPFCSERCKNIDLGAWASERYAIPSTLEAVCDVEVSGQLKPRDIDQAR